MKYIGYVLFSTNREAFEMPPSGYIDYGPGLKKMGQRKPDRLKIRFRHTSGNVPIMGFYPIGGTRKKILPKN